LSEIDNAFELSNTQEQNLKPIIKNSIAKLKRSILPEVIKNLEKFSNQQNKLSPKQINQFQQKVQEGWIKSLSLLAKDTTTFINTLSKNQQQSLINYQRNQRDELYNLTKVGDTEYPEAYKNYLEEHFLDSYEWLAEPSPTQIALYEENYYKEKKTLRYELNLREVITKEFFAQYFKQPLAERPKFLIKWAKAPGEKFRKQYQHYRANRNKLWINFLKKLESTLSKKQILYRKEYISKIIMEVKAFQAS
tara:strand:- start:550 stop:1296 length:747 start_codon:yes stop_codon:yes gene_type:complete